VVTAKALFQETGGLAAERAGAQDYDLFIKLSEKANKIVHLPEILYHWRASETSTSINHDQKEYADEAGRLSLVDAIARRNIEAEVLPTEWKFYYRVKRELSLLPLVSLVVYWDQQDQEPSAWFSQLIAITAYKNYELIFLHDDRCYTEPLRSYLASIDQPARLVKVPEQQGIAALYNLALQYCDGDYLGFISSDVVISDSLWLSVLLEYCQVTDTGAVCGRLDCIHPDLTEITPVPDIGNESAWYYARYLQQASLLMNGLHCPQNIWNVDWQCCLVNKEAFEQCGGFAAGEFSDLFAPHDLSFRLLERGWQIYYTPHCRMDWRADARRFAEKGRHDSWHAEKQAFKKKWQATLSAGDPYFNKGVLHDTPISLEEFDNWLAGNL
jgi:GT2 family glycosyltransferase